MTTTHTSPAEIAATPLRTGVFAAIAAAIVRARARHAYHQMLAREDHVLRDMGVNRREIRQALLECGGHPDARPVYFEDRS